MVPGVGVTEAYDEATREWLHGVVAAGFVPGERARARAALADLLEEAVAAVRAEPFDPGPGYRIGVELVDLRMAAPAVAGATVRVLSTHLPRLAEGDADTTRARVQALVAQVITGFVTAQRDVAVGAAEEMNRSEKIHWRRVQRALHRRLRDALLHERQTGLPNRQHLTQLIADRIGAGAGRGAVDGRIGLCLLGVDGYAELTDALGPDNGDRLLAAVADRLRRVAEQGGNLLAHLGDDRFVLLATAPGGPDDVVKAADAARRSLAAPVPIDGYQFTVGVTAGIAEGPIAGSTPEGWLRDAGLALDWARQERRDHAVFEPARAGADRLRHRLAAALPDALARGEIVPHFQPMFALADHRVVAVEALARWERPAGLPTLPAQQLVSVAEHTGLIRQLGRAILERACRQAAEWRRLGNGVPISVNLSPLQLSDPALVADVGDILHRAGLPAELLQLEITESAAVDEREDVLRRLTGLGVTLAVDDFGTGYASLAALTRLPITRVKLAAELVASPGAAIVLRHTVELCHALGMWVTAEGIETAEQEQLLRELGCDAGQGFRLARPVPAAELVF
jgi:diguanylate cyclase (GGDEF)-like protein